MPESSNLEHLGIGGVLMRVDVCHEMISSFSETPNIVMRADVEKLLQNAETWLLRTCIMFAPKPVLNNSLGHLEVCAISEAANTGGIIPNNMLSAISSV